MTPAPATAVEAATVVVPLAPVAVTVAAVPLAPDADLRASATSQLVSERTHTRVGNHTGTELVAGRDDLGLVDAGWARLE